MVNLIEWHIWNTRSDCTVDTFGGTTIDVVGNVARRRSYDFIVTEKINENEFFHC